MGTIEYILELIATVAFAISGANVAIKKEMDIFGVTILALTTAIGGGIIRDTILGIVPPAMLSHWEYPLIAILTGLVMFITPVRRAFRRAKILSHDVVLFTDSLGLGLFTVVGIKICIDAGHGDEYFMQLFLAVMTACGGGVLRDVLANDLPNIFFRHFYASASMCGAIVCILLWRFVPSLIAMSAGALVCVILRILAAHYRWNMPRAHADPDDA